MNRHTREQDTPDFSTDSTFSRTWEECGADLRPDPDEAHEFPTHPLEGWDDFDDWAERAIKASGFGAAALDID